MDLVSWFRRPRSRLTLGLAGFAVLASLDLVWGALAYQTPPRLHLAGLNALIGAGAVLWMARRPAEAPLPGALRLLAGLVFLVPALGLGGYDHLLRLALSAHGLPGFAPAPEWAYQALGLALLPLGLGGLALLRAERPPKEEE